jgi:hypothetical protein
MGGIIPSSFLLDPVLCTKMSFIDFDFYESGDGMKALR